MFISCISAAVFLESSASTLISSATTANPFPDSPALAASIEAFNANRFVCSVISKIDLDKTSIFSTSFDFFIASNNFSCVSILIFSAVSLDRIAASLSSFALFFIINELLNSSFEYLNSFHLLEQLFLLLML